MRTLQRQPLWVICSLAATLVINSALCALADELSDAIANYRTGHYAQADKSLAQLHQSDPSNLRATYYLAITRTRLGRYDDARNLYEQVIAHAPAGSTEANLAEQGIQYLPPPGQLDLPPRPGMETTAESPANTTPHASIQSKFSFPYLSKAPTTPTSQAAPQAASANPDGSPVSAQAALAAQQQARQNQFPNAAQQQGGMSPDDMMAVQMMMGNNNNNNNNGFNPMMLYMMQNQNGQQGNGQNGGNNPYSHIDPEVMSQMMTNQMLQNMDFSGSDNNK